MQLLQYFSMAVGVNWDCRWAGLRPCSVWLAWSCYAKRLLQMEKHPVPGPMQMIKSRSHECQRGRGLGQWCRQESGPDGRPSVTGTVLVQGSSPENCFLCFLAYRVVLPLMHFVVAASDHQKLSPPDVGLWTSKTMKQNEPPSFACGLSEALVTQK